MNNLIRTLFEGDIYIQTYVVYPIITIVLSIIITLWTKKIIITVLTIFIFFIGLTLFVYTDFAKVIFISMKYFTFIYSFLSLIIASIITCFLKHANYSKKTR